MSAVRHVLMNSAIFAATVAVSIYLHPYSLHHVVHTSYEEFDQVPNDDGVNSYGMAEHVNFRLPRSGLSPRSVSEIRKLVSSVESSSHRDSLIAAKLTEFVRDQLNQEDASLPSAASLNTEQLMVHGSSHYSLCSDYSRLLNEVLQVAGLTSRVLWMEGHVAVEYFDTFESKWVFLDPHLNCRARLTDGTSLSMAQLVHAVEREQHVDWMPIVPEGSSGQPDSFAGRGSNPGQFDEIWYRNILLNGECYTLSGATLASQGRWHQLVSFHSLPQVVLLKTPFDTSGSQLDAPLRVRSVILLYLVLMICFYAGRIPHPFSAFRSAFINRRLAGTARTPGRASVP
ncbi:MAG: hypothetical protein JNL58_15005 [Planctomyces sp.]|nr:hypothetical protein [Planctomyces sp.]